MPDYGQPIEHNLHWKSTLDFFKENGPEDEVDAADRKEALRRMQESGTKELADWKAPAPNTTAAEGGHRRRGEDVPAEDEITEVAPDEGDFFRNNNEGEGAFDESVPMPKPQVTSQDHPEGPGVPLKNGFTEKERRQLSRDDRRVNRETYPQDPEAMPSYPFQPEVYQRPSRAAEQRERRKKSKSIEESLLKLMKREDEPPMLYKPHNWKPDESAEGGKLLGNPAVHMGTGSPNWQESVADSTVGLEGVGHSARTVGWGPRSQEEHVQNLGESGTAPSADVERQAKAGGRTTPDVGEGMFGLPYNRHQMDVIQRIANDPSHEHHETANMVLDTISQGGFPVKGRELDMPHHGLSPLTANIPEEEGVHTTEAGGTMPTHWAEQRRMGINNNVEKALLKLMKADEKPRFRATRRELDPFSSEEPITYEPMPDLYGATPGNMPRTPEESAGDVGSNPTAAERYEGMTGQRSTAMPPEMVDAARKVSARRLAQEASPEAIRDRARREKMDFYTRGDLERGTRARADMEADPSLYQTQSIHGRKLPGTAKSIEASLLKLMKDGDIPELNPMEDPPKENKESKALVADGDSKRPKSEVGTNDKMFKKAYPGAPSGDRRRESGADWQPGEGPESSGSPSYEEMKRIYQQRMINRRMAPDEHPSQSKDDAAQQRAWGNKIPMEEAIEKSLLKLMKDEEIASRKRDLPPGDSPRPHGSPRNERMREIGEMITSTPGIKTTRPLNVETILPPEKGESKEDWIARTFPENPIEESLLKLMKENYPGGMSEEQWRDVEREHRLGQQQGPLAEGTVQGTPQQLEEEPMSTQRTAGGAKVTGVPAEVVDDPSKFEEAHKLHGPNVEDLTNSLLKLMKEGEISPAKVGMPRRNAMKPIENAFPASQPKTPRGVGASTASPTPPRTALETETSRPDTDQATSTANWSAQMFAGDLAGKFNRRFGTGKQDYMADAKQRAEWDAEFKIQNPQFSQNGSSPNGSSPNGSAPQGDTVSQGFGDSGIKQQQDFQRNTGTMGNMGRPIYSSTKK